MTAARRFSGPALEELAKAKIVGVRAGTEYRYTGVWVVVVEGRVFARSSNNKPTGCELFHPQWHKPASAGSNFLPLGKRIGLSSKKRKRAFGRD